MQNCSHAHASQCLLICILFFLLSGLHAATRPNIILVLTDDQGYGDLGCHGNPILKTPNLDSFHRQSVRFTDFMVSPTCAPTRAALLTGRHEFKSGVTHTIFERERLSTNAITIAQILKNSGYATGIFGKWHLGDETAYQPQNRGFDEVFIHGGGGIGQTYPGTCGDAPGNSYFDPHILHNGRFRKTSGYCTDVFFGQALKWIQAQRTRKQPFFAVIALNAPHAPLEVPPSWASHYGGLNGVSTNQAKFFGMIANLDDNFGQLTTRLRDWNLETNSLVIFMTDNGGTVGVPLFNAGMRGGKATPWLGATRVPSFWRWPAGFRGGVDCPQLTAHVDVFPTLMDLAGVQSDPDTRSQLEGRSLLPLLKNPVSPWPDRTLVTHVGRWETGKASSAKLRNVSIRNARFQMVSATTGNTTNSPRWELFDLIHDPGETTDVRGKFPEVAHALEDTYHRWWNEVLPHLATESTSTIRVNPFKALYWQQLGGGPDRETTARMDPVEGLKFLK